MTITPKKTAKQCRQRATELEWLSYFYCEADFGPAHGDVVDNIKHCFRKETGKDLPDGYDGDNEE